ncbi:hypothetical protein KKD52_04890, partial [Myxococcota bacterium]|nr:hypothetical protein [Myxococcota bacterium]
VRHLSPRARDGQRFSVSFALAGGRSRIPDFRLFLLQFGTAATGGRLFFSFFSFFSFFFSQAARSDWSDWSDRSDWSDSSDRAASSSSLCFLFASWSPVTAMIAMTGHLPAVSPVFLVLLFRFSAGV